MISLPGWQLIPESRPSANGTLCTGGVYIAFEAGSGQIMALMGREMSWFVLLGPWSTRHLLVR